MRKLGLIAGGGDLPLHLAAHCRTADRPLFVLRLKGMAVQGLSRFEGADVGLAELGRGLKELRDARCEAVCMAGYVARPDFRNFMPDLRGLMALPGVLMAARKGDAALLEFMVREFEKEGFDVEGAHQVMGELTLGSGPLGAIAPDDAQL